MTLSSIQMMHLADSGVECDEGENCDDITGECVESEVTACGAPCDSNAQCGGYETCSHAVRSTAPLIGLHCCRNLGRSHCGGVSRTSNVSVKLRAGLARPWPQVRAASDPARCAARGRTHLSDIVLPGA